MTNEEAAAGAAERYRACPYLMDKIRLSRWAEEGRMTIPLKKLKARLLANRRVKAEYDALAREFDAACIEAPRPRVTRGKT
jgi:hypothetical protein